MTLNRKNTNLWYIFSFSFSPSLSSFLSFSLGFSFFLDRNWNFLSNFDTLQSRLMRKLFNTTSKIPCKRLCPESSVSCSRDWKHRFTSIAGKNTRRCCSNPYFSAVLLLISINQYSRFQLGDRLSKTFTSLEVARKRSRQGNNLSRATSDYKIKRNVSIQQWTFRS